MRHRVRTSWVERVAIRLGWAGGRPPTDFELLRAIYERHDADFEANSATRETRVYQPINIPAIAEKLEANADMVFGRLYHETSTRSTESGLNPVSLANRSLRRRPVPRPIALTGR